MSEVLGDLEDALSDLLGGRESDDGQPATGPIRSPAALLLDRMVDGQVVPSPVTSAHLPVLMDRTTTVPPQQATIPGLINVNTAQRFVLTMLEGLTEEQVKIASHNYAINARGIVGQDVTFNAIRLKDESEV